MYSLGDVSGFFILWAFPLITFAGLVTVVVALVIGIKGLKTKQYGGFKKALKFLGFS